LDREKEEYVRMYACAAAANFISATYSSFQVDILLPVLADILNCYPSYDMNAASACRYTVAYAIEALQQMRHSRAYDILLPFLKAARWCSFTNNKSSY
jgi:hypothetical protein